MKTNHWPSLIFIALLGLAVGLTGIQWGLPSARRVALMGDTVAKARIELARRTSHELETRRDHSGLLSTQPAEESIDPPRLLRRYLMFTDSPDEVLTLMALSNMRPRQWDFNPRVVVYSGLHLYGTGAAMVLGHLGGFGRITNDIGYYVDHPEAMARLYISGRFLMVLYNLGIALLLYLFGTELAGAAGAVSRPTLCGLAAAFLWLLSPLSLAFSHIINPHLPTAFYGTLSVWLTWRAMQHSNLRCWLGAAAASGAAASCTPNGGLSFLALLFALGFKLREHRRDAAKNPGFGGRQAGQLLGLALATSAMFYFALNPYFLANLDVLREELNRLSHFQRPQIGILNILRFGGQLLPQAIGLSGVAIMLIGLASLWKHPSVANHTLFGYVATGLVVIPWMIGTGTDNPLNIRFAMLLVPLLCLLMALVLVGPWPRWARTILAILIGSLALQSSAIYLVSFTRTARDDAGEFINRQLPPGCALAVPKSPGPYKMPAFDFSRVQLITTPQMPFNFIVRVEDQNPPPPPPGFDLIASFPAGAYQFATPLSFSGRSVRIYQRNLSLFR